VSYPSDLARTKNWGTEILTDADLESQLDLIITWVMAALNASSGHKHDATSNEGPKVLVSDLNLTSGAAGDVVYHNGTNLIRLAKGTAYQNLRMNSGATAPEWGGAQISDVILRGFELTFKTTADVYVEPGSLMNGTTFVNKTARTTLTLATAADWVDGSAPTLTSIWIYVYAKNDGTIKLDENAPNYADTSGNQVGTLLYYKDASLNYWRIVGAVRTNGSNNILKFFQSGNEIVYDDPISVITGFGTTFEDVTCSTAVPNFGSVGIRVQGTMTRSGEDDTAAIYIRTNGSSSTDGRVLGNTTLQSLTGTGILITADAFIVTDSTQKIEAKISASTDDEQLWVTGYSISNIK